METVDRDSQVRARVALAAAITVAGLVLQGCAQKPEQASPAQLSESHSVVASDQPAAVASSGDTETARLPSDSTTVAPPEIVAHPTCYEPAGSQDMAYKQACATLRHGKIAVIDFGPMDSGVQYDATTVANLTTQGLQHATDGYLAPSATVFTATPEAQAALRPLLRRNANGDRCVDWADSDHWMSTIAQQTMALQLKGFTLIDALGGESCDDPSQSTTDTAGFSNEAANTGDIYVADDLTEKSKDSTEMQIAETEEHEDLHRKLAGLGHAGTIDCGEGVTSAQTADTEAIDLSTMLAADCKYDEYGDDGLIMSGQSYALTSPSSMLLSPEELDYLHQTSPTPEPQYGLKLTSGQTTVIGVEEQAQYARMPLPASVLVDGQFEAQVQTKGVLTSQNPLKDVNFQAVTIGTGDQAKLGVKVIFTTASSADQFRQVALKPYELGSNGLTFTLGDEIITVVTQGGALALTAQAQ